MSLVPTYVQCADGKWYKDPLMGNIDTYFLCFDDDEPPEIVIDEECFNNGIRPENVIKALHLDALQIGKLRRSERCFGKSLIERSNKIEMKPAVSCFIRIYRAPDPKTVIRHDGVSQNFPKPDCVLYEFIGQESYWDKFKNEDTYFNIRNRFGDSGRILYRIKDNIKPLISEVILSKKGVPHLVVNFKGIQYSVCYFKKSHSFRVFWPYMDFDNQNKIELKLWTDVINFFKKEA